ncbi:MAG: hypothetical protein HY584_00925 [Candidatus Omnitrophica bacterium]|nr:hypothetical protein [Candidatus Omnitrophota bacterium]
MNIVKPLKKVATKLGYEIRQIDWTYDPNSSILRRDLCSQNREIMKRHFLQTEETVIHLRNKYEKPILGKIDVLDLLKRLGECIDPSDTKLAGVSQLAHVLQVAEAMENDGVIDSDLLIAALIHDLGKILLLTDEALENIVGMNCPIGEYEEGIGFDHCFFQWNHDEFAYWRLKDYLPDPVSWLIRYHSILLPESARYMDERDRQYSEKYLIPFQKYDQGSKSVFRIPKKRIDDYRGLIHQYFPEVLTF